MIWDLTLVVVILGARRKLRKWTLARNSRALKKKKKRRGRAIVGGERVFSIHIGGNLCGMNAAGGHHGSAGEERARRRDKGGGRKK